MKRPNWRPAAECAVTFVAVFALALVAYNAWNPHLPQLTVHETTTIAEVVDPSDTTLMTAQLKPLLVQWGTMQPYTGTGAPGVVVSVVSNGTVADWALSAWLNDTSPPTLSLCHSREVFFDPYNWVFQSTGGTSSVQGNFISGPSTVPQRAEPNGDQCLARANEVGTYDLLVCLNRGGVPPGHFVDSLGGHHFKGWDRCLESKIQVHP